MKNKVIYKSDHDIQIRVLYNGEGYTKFELLEDVHYTRFGYHFVVPAGFLTDGRSSPGFLKTFFPTWGKGAKAWLLHDWMYAVDYGVEEYGWSKKEARKFADDMMYLYSELYNPEEPIRNYLSYKYVSLFGSKVYAQDREIVLKSKILNHVKAK